MTCRTALLGILALLAAASAASGQPAASGPSATLWYRGPASNWNEALPVGNGRLGAMVFGGIAEERLQLNEDTVWAGERRDRVNPGAAQAIREVRRLLFAGQPAEAEALADKAIISIPRRLPPYQTLGDLRLRFEGLDGVATDYRRDLDIDSAISRVRFRQHGTLFEREVFVSAVDQVIVVRLTRLGPARISLRATLGREQDAAARASSGDQIVLEGQAIPRGDRYADERKTGAKFVAALQAVAQGGRVFTEGSVLAVEGAEAVTLLLAAATDIREPDPGAACSRVLQAAAARPFARLRADHVSDYQRLFRRVTIDLAGGIDRMGAADLPTDERLARLQAGGADPALEALYFQFGRYLLISSSRPGSMAANLQGIWNESLAPPWESKYTININTEMNYWPAEVANLGELHEPLFDLIDRALPDGRRVAREMYGASGFVLHHNTDVWGHAVPIDGVGSGIWPMGGAWLSLHLWDHYDFGRDREFLRTRAYPVLKEAAQFLLDYLTPDPQGRLVTGPSISPENRYRLADGTVGRLCMGPAMDTEIAQALFTRVVAASEILGEDEAFRRAVGAARDRLVPLEIGAHGQLQEWLEDYEEAEPGHRHISHLFALHPGDQITPRGTPGLARAARVTLERRLAAGSGHTGWSRAWIINFWARLEEGDLAHENLVALLAKSTLPSLLDNHPPFQIDGNFGATAGMAEMLVQSHAGEIALLPALPAAWPDGEVRGLRARGNVEIDLAWRAGKAARASMRARTSGDVRLRPRRGDRIAEIRTGGRAVPTVELPDGAVRVGLLAGRRYEVSFR